MIQRILSKVAPLGGEASNGISSKPLDIFFECLYPSGEIKMRRGQYQIESTDSNVV